jgi:NAD(P)-dependent dehydrogenase (short-subunit alcohol dehydrogenase family)
MLTVSRSVAQKTLVPKPALASRATVTAQVGFGRWFSRTFGELLLPTRIDSDDGRPLIGRRALITGASSGLGAHFATVLANAGADIVIAARRVDALETRAEQLRELDVSVQVLELDVTNAPAVRSSCASLGAVDILVNNAGVVRPGHALDQSEGDWDAVMDVNLKGMFFVAQAVAEQMKAAQKDGSIINVASILGLRQATGVLPYAVSKAAVIHMTRIMALEFARFGIRVNALAPGYVSTDLNRDYFDTPSGQAMIQRIPQRRLGELHDLSGPLLLLAADASSYMTGSVLVVDGGHLLSGL